MSAVRNDRWLRAPGPAMAFIGDGLRAMKALAENHYRATDELVERLDLGEDVRESLRQTYERWDGKGAYGMKGEEIALSSRLINLADVVEVFGRTGGVEAAIMVARERSGTQFDPELVDAFCEQAAMVLTELDQTPSWEAVIAAEPALGREVAGEELDLALEAIGEFAELKSPWIMGHVHAVRDLVTEAATSFGLPERRRSRTAPSGMRLRPRPARGPEHGLGQAWPADPVRAGTGAHPPVPERADARVRALTRGSRQDRGPASRATRRLRLSPWPFRRADRDDRAVAGRGGRVPGPVRAAPTPAGPARTGRGRRAAPRGDRRAT